MKNIKIIHNKEYAKLKELEKKAEHYEEVHEEVKKTYPTSFSPDWVLENIFKSK